MKLPENDQDKKVGFNWSQKQLPVPFVIYTDLDSYIEKIDHCLPYHTRSSTTEYQRHTPSGFFYMVFSTVDGYTKKQFSIAARTLLKRSSKELPTNTTQSTALLQLLCPFNLHQKKSNINKLQNALFMANAFVGNGQFVITTISRGNTEEQHTPTVTSRLS